ncbi:DNA alkylation repair protein [Reichenbachiella versicolor]|uniref:DNA alkylation repair protein n=1 Tax=Reichenbachiella versicolor TaxID=1821036 RepID=UPI000D6E1FF0|nr:DNA alkylation repair protein [Reichenbachiella versicolor]
MEIKLPEAASSIQKGVPLKEFFNRDTIYQIATNLYLAHPSFDKDRFLAEALNGIEKYELKPRAQKIAEALRRFLPEVYSEAIPVIINSLTPPLDSTMDNGLAPMIYMPHCEYIAKYGLDPCYNQGVDPFDLSMSIQYEITKRYTCEFSVRSFINADQDRTFEYFYEWMNDENPHVRRLCSEGARPRLPWASKLRNLAEDPIPSIKILEHLKNDPVLYVRRSVANHVGDIAKDNLELALDLCEEWLNGASKELRWVIRHALRYPFKKGVERAVQIRMAAK